MLTHTHTAAHEHAKCALMFLKCQIDISKNANRQCGHAERQTRMLIMMDLFVCVEVSFLVPIDLAPKMQKIMRECGDKMRVRQRRPLQLLNFT